MSTINLFWGCVSLVVALIVLLALRELVYFIRLPRAHPDRGPYGFNGIILLIASVAVFWAGAYIDGGRSVVESLVSPYPGARYAFEQSEILHRTSLVYETKDPASAVVAFYRDEAKRSGIQLVVDESSEERLSFLLPSGNLFLTLKERGGMTVLYYSREGTIAVVTEEQN